MGFGGKLIEQKLFMQALFLWSFCLYSSSAHSHRDGGFSRMAIPQGSAVDMKL